MHRRRVATVFVVSTATLALLVLFVSRNGAGGRVDASPAGPEGEASSWRVAAPITYQNLTLFPVLSMQEADTSEFATLDEALASGAAVVSEGTQDYQKIYRASPIGTSVDAFAQEIGRRFERITSGLKGERVVGVVVAFGDEVAWSDIFASSELFNAYRQKLLRSYVVEAMTRPGVRETATLDDARDFLRPIAGHVEQESEPGVYEWRKESVGRLSEIQLAALTPKPLALHIMRVLRGDERSFMAQ